ncbi:MAG: helix-turn-helix transcriptional regulator [Candidatus Izemoplasmatales bacterium]|nr:helix-turn-helix transcriptional regulator [Candidatus Izemoplasmatales bacterium]NLF48201.1 helix-turn-helix transcriptional regulator [Acholeplasmataceae bacterium]MDD4355297.1 helix-turn-helix transcriptional regulator [Candidatus Izemoplasmatales bacterium]MDD4987954.1 helix-turn-helix transcriptional regulator [Candidatus Izemoplasmatales bacterium]MDD5601472.1 helix-turn-helix transcriptional regulator [Candidatus Izemoplasmatales bacterium]
MKSIFSRNLIYYRKAFDLTQIQLAEKLSYSDKSVSKWERKEALPDLVVMTKMATLFGISLNDLISSKTPRKVGKYTRNRYLIATMMAVGIWAIATAVFVFLRILLPDMEKTWLAYIYAIPASFLVLSIFFRIWNHRLIVFIFSSITLWTLALSIFLSFENPRLWLFFIAGIPLQILLVLWLVLLPRKALPPIEKE